MIINYNTNKLAYIFRLQDLEPEVLSITNRVIQTMRTDRKSYSRKVDDLTGNIVLVHVHIYITV